MNKDNQLAVVTPGAQYKNLSLAEIKDLAGAMVSARMFPDLETANTAYVKILAGQEMGIAPFQAMSNIHIIKGRATLAANLMATKVKESGRYDYRVKSLTEELCIIDFYGLENGKRVLLGTSTFSRKDAETAGTQNMSKFGRNMLFARAMSNGVKWYTPDVFGGTPVYVPGEIVEGEIVEPPVSSLDQPIEPEVVAVESNSGDAGENDTTPLTPQSAEPLKPTAHQRTQVRNLMLANHVSSAEDQKTVFKGLTDRDTFDELTRDEADELVKQLEKTTPELLREMFLTEPADE